MPLPLPLIGALATAAGAATLGIAAVELNEYKKLSDYMKTDEYKKELTMKKAYYNGPLRRQEGTPAGQGGERRYNENTVDQYENAVDRFVNGQFETKEQKDAARTEMMLLERQLPDPVAKEAYRRVLKDRRGTGDLSYNNDKNGV